MEAISVKGATRLKGNVTIQGSKNTVLPLMAASLLVSGVTVITNCPEIDDVFSMCELLKCLHIETKLVNHALIIDTNTVEYAALPGELTCKLRSSVLLMGSMLARFGKVEIGLPGGCAIGARPIDIHLDGFRQMNVDVNCEKAGLVCHTDYLQACRFSLRFPSVGATENLLMAAVMANGLTILRGVAIEPEIIELCYFLKNMGALIDGIGTDTLIIKGTKQMSAIEYQNPYDRIVAGTYLLMLASIPSKVRIYGIDNVSYIKNILDVISDMGVSVIKMGDCLCIDSGGMAYGGTYMTGVYPDFPTDLQPVLITVLTNAINDSLVTEQIFENRLGIVKELLKLNATIEIDGNQIYITGNKTLQGHTVKAMDLRQGAALVVAGVLAKGYTTVTNIEFIKRGYEDIVRDLAGLGIEISYA